MGQATPCPGDPRARFSRFLKLLAALGLFVAACAALLAIHRALADRRSLHTGEARWIWYSREIPRKHALRFRAWRDFRLEAAPRSASARLFVDREGSLEVNGRRAFSGSRRPGDPLFVLDLAPYLKAGENRIVIEAGSPTGVGGVLFWLDLGGGRTVVSDGSWQVERVPPAADERPRPAAVWGSPPMYPWGYPGLPEARRSEDAGRRERIGPIGGSARVC